MNEVLGTHLFFSAKQVKPEGQVPPEQDFEQNETSGASL